MKKFDYSSLDKLTYNNYDSFVAALFCFGPLISTVVFTEFGLLAIGVAGGFMLVGALLWQRLQTIKKERKSILKTFARANGINYLPNQKGNDQYHGSLPQLMKAKRTREAFDVDIDGFRVNIFQYNYLKILDDSKSSNRLVVAVVELPYIMPNLVIDSHIDESSSDSVLPIKFNKSQKIELEGDFYKYFSVYAMNKAEIEALVILMPDVMQTLLEHGHKCDIEFIGNKLYFYWHMQLEVRRDFEEVFNCVTALLDEIGSRLKRFKADTIPSANNTAGSNVALAKLKNSKFRKLFSASTIPYIFLLLFVVSSYLGNAFIMWLSIMLVVCSVVIPPVIKINLIEDHENRNSR